MEYLSDRNQHTDKRITRLIASFRTKSGQLFGSETNENCADENRASISSEPNTKVMKLKWYERFTSTLISFVKRDRDVLSTSGKKHRLQDRLRSISLKFRKEGRGVLASFRTSVKVANQLNRKSQKHSPSDSADEMQVEEGELAAQINEKTYGVSLNQLQKGISNGACLMKTEQQPCNASAANQLQHMLFASGSNLCETADGKNKDPIVCEQLGMSAAYGKVFEHSDKRLLEEVEFKPKSARNSTTENVSVLVSEYRSWLAANPLEQFEYNCPPGGSDSVVLYFTSLQAIRKTFDDCKIVRQLLQGFQIKVDERDVAMHRAFRVELQDILLSSPVDHVPRLFIKGRHMGGAQEVVKLNEDGTLLKLLKDFPKQINKPCNGCAGVRFIVCTNCNGSRKSFNKGDEEIEEANDEAVVQYCQHCNEIGLIRCLVCL